MSALRPHEVNEALHDARRHLAAGDGLLAQSICLDVLALEAGHVEATSLLVEATALASGSLDMGVGRIETYLAAITDPRERARLDGFLAWRRALSMVDEGVPPFVVQDWLGRARERLLAADPERRDVRLRLAAVERLLKG